jgi:hypothetical protein
MGIAGGSSELARLPYLLPKVYEAGFLLAERGACFDNTRDLLHRSNLNPFDLVMEVG